MAFIPALPVISPSPGINRVKYSMGKNSPNPAAPPKRSEIKFIVSLSRYELRIVSVNVKLIHLLEPTPGTLISKEPKLQDLILAFAPLFLGYIAP